MEYGHYHPGLVITRQFFERVQIAWILIIWLKIFIYKYRIIINQILINEQNNYFFYTQKIWLREPYRSQYQLKLGY